MGTRSRARSTRRIIRSGLVALLLTLALPCSAAGNDPGTLRDKVKPDCSTPLGSVAVSRSSSALRPVSDGVARVEARATGGEIVTTCVCELEYAPKLNAMKAVVARNSPR